MSATVDSNPGASLRKRYREEESNIPLELKRPRICYFRLESESSKASEEDTESVYSVQDRETDVVRDTTDTDSRAETDQDEYEVEIEYEVASLSGDETASCISSSGSENMMLAAAAAAICDSSFETWVTDCEDSDNSSSLDETSFGRTDFMTCVQCKGTNDNPLYRYCDKCFQQSCRQCKMRKTYKCFPLCNLCYKDRKRFFPPRPRGHRKARKNQKKTEPAVKLDTLRSCLSGLSQDSGIGSSQDCPPLDLDQIIVPDHLNPGTSRITKYDEEKLKEIKEASVEQAGKDERDTDSISLFSSGDLFSDKNIVEEKSIEKETSLSSNVVSTLGSERDFNVTKRKRQMSESSLSDYDVKRTRFEEKKLDSKSTTQESSDLGYEGSFGSFSSGTTEKSDASEVSELCIFCNSAPKDSIFLHTNIAHRCCCYSCAKKTLHTIKRCPICNRRVNKVVKIYTS